MKTFIKYIALATLSCLILASPILAGGMSITGSSGGTSASTPSSVTTSFIDAGIIYASQISTAATRGFATGDTVVVDRNQAIELDGPYSGSCGGVSGGSCIVSSSVNFQHWAGTTNTISCSSTRCDLPTVPLRASSTKNKACVALSGGSQTATVDTNAVCMCADQTTPTIPCKAVVASTTLTMTAVAGGSDVVCYICL